MRPVKLWWPTPSRPFAVERAQRLDVGATAALMQIFLGRHPTEAMVRVVREPKDVGRVLCKRPPPDFPHASQTPSQKGRVMSSPQEPWQSDSRLAQLLKLSPWIPAQAEQTEVVPIRTSIPATESTVSDICAEHCHPNESALPARCCTLGKVRRFSSVVSQWSYVPLRQHVGRG